MQYVCDVRTEESHMEKFRHEHNEELMSEKILTTFGLSINKKTFQAGEIHYSTVFTFKYLNQQACVNSVNTDIRYHRMWLPVSVYTVLDSSSNFHSH